MVLPVLQFGGPEAFNTLVEPDAYYVVTVEHQDNSMRLSLAYRYPACALALPPYLTFEARSTPYYVVVMADTAIRGNIWDQHVLNALRALNVPLTYRAGHAAYYTLGPFIIGCILFAIFNSTTTRVAYARCNTSSRSAFFQILAPS